MPLSAAMLEQTLVGDGGGSFLGLAWRERETAGEIRKVRFGVDGGTVYGRCGAGCGPSAASGT